MGQYRADAAWKYPQYTCHRNGASKMTSCHKTLSALLHIVSDNGFLPVRRQGTIWTNAGLLLIGPWGTNFSEILIELLIIFIQESAFEYVVCEMAAILSPLQCAYHVFPMHYHIPCNLSLPLIDISKSPSYNIYSITIYQWYFLRIGFLYHEFLIIVALFTSSHVGNGVPWQITHRGQFQYKDMILPV